MMALGKRLWQETDHRALRKFIFTFGLNGMRAVRAFEKRLRKGVHFPAFLFVSVTNACNLSCQGCWVTPSRPPLHMSLDTLRNLVEVSRSHGCRFFGILGGEPLLHKGIYDLFAAYPDCYFLLFTNGTLLDEAVAERLRVLGNVTPLVSVEGDEVVSDVRRGGENVFNRTMDGIDACRRHRLVTGVATSVSRSNIDALVTEAFLERLIARGVHYVWYYIYRPVGPNPAPELALDEEQILRLRRFMVEARCRYPVAIIDAYWDHLGRALCPAATGIGHHISPDGYVEPCPPIQAAADNIAAPEGLYETISQSTFLQRFRELACQTTRGCIIMEDPAKLLDLVNETNAHDSSGRGTIRDELAAMKVTCSHHIPGREIPEKSWGYRMAKKNWFFGFGAYG